MVWLIYGLLMLIVDFLPQGMQSSSISSITAATDM
jgi:hypothetical protein